MCETKLSVRFEVFTAGSIKMAVFWVDIFKMVGSQAREMLFSVESYFVS